jgi:hypothetical protein
MAIKADFTPEEWETLQWAVTDTMAYLSMADRGFWDTFKEANAAAHFIADTRADSLSLLVRDLASDVKGKRDKEVTANPTDMAGEVAERVSEAVALISDKAPDELPAFKEFIVGIAKATAEAAGGIGETEAAAIEKVKAALG